MTIFDTLKYPISTPPTQDEIGNLPVDLYERFLNSIYNNTSDESIFNELRRMIKEYEPPEIPVKCVSEWFNMNTETILLKNREYMQKSVYKRKLNIN